MRVHTLNGTDSLAKAESIVRLPGVEWAGTVLDVGCRSRELETALSEFPVSYVGMDIDESGDIHGDVGSGIPLEDGEVDVVVALDVLEHADDIHHAFDELCRVSRRNVVISLPNCYEIAARIKYLRGRPISGKYGLPVDKPGDRHRWVFGFLEAQKFVSCRGAKNNWDLAYEAGLVGPRRSKLSSIINRWPNMFAPTYVVSLVPPAQPERD